MKNDDLEDWGEQEHKPKPKKEKAEKPTSWTCHGHLSPLLAVGIFYEYNGSNCPLCKPRGKPCG